jgi:hypothetical protein
MKDIKKKQGVMEKLIGPLEQAAIAAAAPKSTDLVEVSEMPQYNTSQDASYKHMGLRARQDVGAGNTLLLEEPVACVPVGRFVLHINDKAAPSNPENYVSEDKLKAFAQEKADYFKQDWPFMCPFLTPYHNQDYLQLTCILIVKGRDRPFKTPDDKGESLYLSRRPPHVSAITFEQFVACMHTLAFFKVSRKQIAPWIVFEEFQRLYDVVAANAYTSATLVSEQKFALALFPTAARINHSCRPNCIRMATPTGMYIVATQDIKAGEELTVSYVPRYIPEFVDVDVFQANLQRNWGFSCKCNWCNTCNANDKANVCKAGNRGDSRIPTTPVTPATLANDPDYIMICEALQAVPQILSENGEMDSLPLLMDELNQLVKAQDCAGVMDKCEDIRAKFSHVLESNPRLGYVVSRHFVKLLQARQTLHVMDSILVDCMKLYPYWSTLYAKSVAAKCGTHNIHFLIATFYQVVFYMISTKGRGHGRPLEPPIGVEPCHTLISNDDGGLEGAYTPLQETEFLNAFFDHYVAMLHLSKDLLGSHWFLWTEFAMYFGLDVFIKEIEEGLRFYTSGSDDGGNNSVVRTDKPAPVTLGDMEDYVFDINPDEMGSTPLMEVSCHDSGGKPAGTVQKGYIKDSSDPDLLVHHAKSMALSKQVEEMQAEEKRNTD